MSLANLSDDGLFASKVVNDVLANQSNFFRQSLLLIKKSEVYFIALNLVMVCKMVCKGSY